MAAWKYIKGSEKDFEGAPDEALILTIDNIRRKHFGEVFPESGEKYWSNLGGKGFWGDGVRDLTFNIIAQRERVTSINDDRLAQCIDNVNHPKHYTQGGIECIDAIKAATVGKSGIEAVCVANVVKYLWRYEEKNGVEDVKKARWYLERLISELSEGESK